MELRLGDASANPYLAIAGLLAAAISASATNWSLRHRLRAMDTTRARLTSFRVILRRHSTRLRRTPTWPGSLASSSLRPS